MFNSLSDCAIQYVFEQLYSRKQMALKWTQVNNIRCAVNLQMLATGLWY